MATRSDPQPPFSPELLADLHGDGLAPEAAAELWPRVREDPQAQSYLNSLDEVNAALRALAAGDRPAPPMPADVAARLESFVDALEPGTPPEATAHHPDFGAAPPESSTPGPISLADHRRKRLRWLAAAAAAVVLLTGAGFAIQLFRDADGAPGVPTAQPPTPGPTTEESIPATVALAALGRFEATGDLASRDTLGACVEGAGLGARKILGSTDMTFAGVAAVLILLTGPDGQKITALVVGTACTPADPQVKDVRDIG
ncbi:hypothetical protein AB0C65_05245 [Nocardia sp. NPDC048505]|uniref:hypothetical protein n=1 Tax=Nocardia sp. NPDC048505 TaxID=3155756 RepID=UPI0033E5A9A9